MLAELGIRARGFVVAALLALASTGGRIAFAQDHPAAPDAIPLTVRAGVPLHVVLEKPVLIKQVDVLVEAHVVDPVFVFDQLASPSGSQVLGRVTKVKVLRASSAAWRLPTATSRPSVRHKWISIRSYSATERDWPSTRR